ncbi:MAG: hypothetical protein ACFB6R_00280 [Alphaproteobacteria bacterium]
MATAFDIARQHIAAALGDAKANSQDRPTVVRALLSVVIEEALRDQSQDELRQQVAFIIDHADPDTDFPFMRP